MVINRENSFLNNHTDQKPFEKYSESVKFMSWVDGTTNRV